MKKKLNNSKINLSTFFAWVFRRRSSGHYFPQPQRAAMTSTECAPMAQWAMFTAMVGATAASDEAATGYNDDSRLHKAGERFKGLEWTLFSLGFLILPLLHLQYPFFHIRIQSIQNLKS